MSAVPEWWARPRTVTVVVDNDSWITPYAMELVETLSRQGDDVQFAATHDAVREGVAAFYLGCVRITPPRILTRNRYNLVVHESDLPKGRGFAPLTWAILDGMSRIAVCLLAADPDEADAGRIYDRTFLQFDGHELNPELRDRQGRATVSLCQAFLARPEPPAGTPQTGTPTAYPRRRPADSRLDPDRTLAEQFELLRVVDNARYPAFFEHRGRRYTLKIEDAGPSDAGTGTEVGRP